MPNHYFGGGTSNNGLGAFDDFFKKADSVDSFLTRLESPDIANLFSKVSTAANQFGNLQTSFTEPQNFSTFSKQVGDTAGQIGSFEGGIDAATKQAGKLGSALRGSLKTATQLGGGSFGGQMFGGIIPEAQGQATALGRQLLALPGQVPDISPTDVVPSQYDMQQLLNTRMPIGFAAADFVPQQSAMQGELDLRRPDAFGVGDFIPTRDAFGAELGLRRPGAFNVGDFIPTKQEFGAELDLRRPGAFGVGDFLPTANEFATQIGLRRPGAFGVGDFIPTRDAFGAELGLRRPDAFDPGEFVPTQDEFEEIMALRRPSPFDAGGLLPTGEQFQEELDLRRPVGFTDDNFLNFGQGSGDTGGDGGDDGDQEAGDTGRRQRNVVQQQRELDAYLEKLQNTVDDLISGPTTAEGLRDDPLTTSLLLDLKQRQMQDRRQAEEDLQRMGVMRSGDTADVLGELTGAQQRAEMDLLADAAERFRADRISGLATGADLFGAAGQRELGLGQLGLQAEQLDLDILAAATALLDPEMKLGGSAAQKQIAQLLLSLTNIPQATKDQLQNAIGWLGVRDS